MDPVGIWIFGCLGDHLGLLADATRQSMSNHQPLDRDLEFTGTRVAGESEGGVRC